MKSERSACNIPPVGWWCSRDAGHDGPCAARRDDEALPAPGKSSDTVLLDWLQEQLNKAEYTGRIVFRKSTTGRGFRFGETSWPGSVADVREALRNAMKEQQ